MKDILQNISQFIEYQFPAHYREDTGAEPTESDRAVIVNFVEAYYEWLEENYSDQFMRSRKMFGYRDIDETLEEFVVYFKEKYLADLPYVYSVDDRFVVKHIVDMYRAKGSEAALKLLIRLLFNEDVNVYYPAVDILRPSHSIWKEPKYLELTTSKRTKDFIGKRVYGSLSGASAFVESLVTKRVSGKFIYILYITDIRGGDFQSGEYISDDGVILNAPRMIGSLTSITVNEGGAGYSVGDRLSVVSSDGKNGVARVTEVLTQSDVVEFELLDGGYGYSVDDSSVYVSTAVLFCNNVSQDFKIFENVTQSLALVNTNNAINASLGDVIVGLDETSNVVANGVIVDINSDSNSFVIEERNGSFEKRYILNLDTANLFINGEIVEEEDFVELEVTSLTAPFTNGEEILQRELIDGVYQNIAIGKLISVTLDTFTIEEAFGTFISGKQIEGLTSGSFANIVSVTITSEGTSGEIVSSSNNSITVKPLGDEFTANNKIRGVNSKNINQVLTINDDGLSAVAVDGNTTYVVSYSDVSATGFVVGQSDDKVGLYGNNYPFYYINESINEITADSGTRVITRIGKGSGATFDIGTLDPETEETANIVSDIIGDENVVDIEYLDLLIDGTNSTINKLNANNYTIIDGGSGYANGESIVFSGGGYLNGDALIDARGEVVVDANGSIIDVVITDAGQGYYQVPTYNISGGSGANIEFSIDTSYGFPKDPTIGFTGIIDDALGARAITIGEIASIKNINKGSNYDTEVFIRVVNEEVQDFIVKDVVLGYANAVGTFAEGEVIAADSGARGRVRSIDIDNDRVNIKNLRLFDRFQIGDTLVGETSNSTATIVGITELVNDLSMGENAQFSAEVFFSDGVIANVAILDSGYGYKDGKTVTLYNSNNEIATTGTSNISKQGFGLGFWKTRSSHLNDKIIRDNRFYQEYSYQTIAAVSFDKYRDIVKDVLHIAGTEIFGKVELRSFVNNSYDIYTSIVEGETIVASGAFIADPNVANTSFLLVGLDGTDSGVGRVNAAVTINDGGLGYSNGIVNLIGGGFGNTTPDNPAEAAIITDDDGTIIDFQINNPGEGYYTVPTFTLTGGTGANVEITVELGYGFIRDPFANINSILGDTLGDGSLLFEEIEVIFEG